MKKIRELMMTAVLLMAAQLACAQTSGTLKSGNYQLRYNISGGTNPEVRDTQGYSHESAKSFICKAAIGSKISLEGIIMSGTADNDEVNFLLSYYDEYGVRLSFNEYKDKTWIKKTITVPHMDRLKYVLMQVSYEKMICVVTWEIDGSVSTPDPTPPAPEETVIDCSCSPRIDSHIRFNDWFGQVMYRCYHRDDDDLEFADWDAVLYECDLIKTWEDSGCILGLEDMSTYVMKEDSRLVINTEEENISKFEMLAGTMWSNIKKMSAGKSLEVEMSQCVAGGGEPSLSREAWKLSVKYKLNPALFGSLEPDLIDEPYAIPANNSLTPAITPAVHYINDDADDNMVFACEVRNGVGTAYVLKGELTLRNKNNKIYKLKAGQSGSIGKDSKIVVKNIDINKIAKKLGITKADLQGFRTPTLSAITTATAVKRYEMERAIVKYKVTQGSHHGVLAKAFDKYGQYERRELKIGNVETIALTQGSTSYALNKKTKKAKRTKDADLNFLNLNETLMKKLNLQKKGTATVMGKQCDHYVGTNVEYYVWKGLVLKKVQKESNGATTIHECTSIEEPTSVDPTMFKLPNGYTVK